MKIVILTGAGVSSDSGLSTFRDSDGLWAKHSIEEVCTAEAWIRSPQRVLNFYNERRRELLRVAPNEGHMAIVDLEKWFDVEVVTQNVDDLHERAGSTKVTHLHGELLKVRSSLCPDLIYETEVDTKIGDLCERGSQLRPHIVFFGESVPNMDRATEIVKKADVLVIIGTSLNVYPAASLVYCLKKGCSIYIVDPGDIVVSAADNAVAHIKERSVIGTPRLIEMLRRDYGK